MPTGQAVGCEIAQADRMAAPFTTTMRISLLCASIHPYPTSQRSHLESSIKPLDNTRSIGPVRLGQIPAPQQQPPLCSFLLVTFTPLG